MVRTTGEDGGGLQMDTGKADFNFAQASSAVKMNNTMRKNISF